MSKPINSQLPTSAQLLKATLIAVLVAVLLLITMVLPAEYGVDPTGVGRTIGLTQLAEPQAPPPAITGAKPQSPAVVEPDLAGLQARASSVFGSNAKQSFDPQAVSFSEGDLRRDTLSITLAPGKGAEGKAHLKKGAGLSFQWSASAAVAVDMHGERPDGGGTWTSYAVEGAQSSAQGTFIAPFEGTHGWYWLNKSDKEVTVRIEVVGLQTDLYRP
ncbi:MULTISPECIES: hypothetical protein [Xanthomonas]|uniref:hypothetical protein n=1 Tax=Xanthomonas TaxID=338 RepID=UPI000E1EB6EA|nr:MULTISPECIES: hypothetical protein [Xanthomonas]